MNTLSLATAHKPLMGPTRTRVGLCTVSPYRAASPRSRWSFGSVLTHENTGTSSLSRQLVCYGAVLSVSRVHATSWSVPHALWFLCRLSRDRSSSPPHLLELDAREKPAAHCVCVISGCLCVCLH